MHDRDEHVASGIEQSDIAPRAVLRWGIALGVFLAGSMLTAYGVYVLYGGPHSARAGGQAAAERRLPPWPRLQANPVKDIEDYRAEQERLATSYAWVDPSRQIVRIPVSRATEFALNRCLPRWPNVQEGVRR